MTDYKIYPIAENGRIGAGVGTQSSCDDDARAVAMSILKPGATAEVWDGTRLIGRVGKSSATLLNHLLSALPQEDMRQNVGALRPVKLVMEQVLHEVGNPVEHVYFLESGLVSLIAETDRGTAEVGMVGREGFVGTSLLLNARPTAAHRAVVQVPGAAFQMQATAFRDAVDQLPTLRDHCLRYLQTLMVQMAQTAACNARHELPARLARWLLMYRDRMEDDELPMTQEFLSAMLGVRRAGVSTAAAALQANRVIRQCRGRVTILDRAGLEAQACSCYRSVEKSQHQIMNDAA